MRTASAAAAAHPLATSSRRPRLVLVPEEETGRVSPDSTRHGRAATPGITARAPRRPAPARQRLAAVLAGLICGFALAALAALAGGGGPGGSLAIAAALGLVLVAVLVDTRRMTVRDRRRRPARAHRIAPRDGAVESRDTARAA